LCCCSTNLLDLGDSDLPPASFGQARAAPAPAPAPASQSQKSKGRGTLFELPSDFLRVPQQRGGAVDNHIISDEELAMMMQVGGAGPGPSSILPTVAYLSCTACSHLSSRRHCGFIFLYHLIYSDILICISPLICFQNELYLRAINEVQRDREENPESRRREHPLASASEIPDMGILKGLNTAGTAMKSGFANLTSKLAAMKDSSSRPANAYGEDEDNSEMNPLVQGLGQEEVNCS
jgi:hypothetical protein